MKRILLCLGTVFMFLNAFSQTETFDIASFVSPKGWQRVDTNGTVQFSKMTTNNGRTSFCFIYLYPSKTSIASPAKNFETEWDNRVAKRAGIKTKPKTKTEKKPGGWTSVSGGTNITQQGISYTSVLTSFSGFNKVMSVLVNIAGNDYLSDVNNFINTLSFQNNTSSNNSGIFQTGIIGPLSLADYIYTAPQGWITTQYPDGIVLSSPQYNTGERCSLTLWPMRTAGNNLQTDANAIFFDVFKAYQLKSSSTPPSMIKGISPQGWEYFIIKKAIGLSGGDYATLFGFVFVAKLDNRLASISGMSKDPLVSSCFGLNLTDVWPKFLYGLQFRNWSSQVSQQTMMQKLAGVWMSVTGSSGDRIVFAPNGRYASAAAAQKYVRVSLTEILRITDFSFGDGTYSISNNQILLTTDDNKNNPETGYMRLEQESKNDGRTWTDKLYLLRKSKVDGNEFEVNYDRQ